MARNLKYTYWRDGEFFIGFLNDYPDYRTQGTSKEDLVENLKSLLEDIESHDIPFIRKFRGVIRRLVKRARISHPEACQELGCE